MKKIVSLFCFLGMAAFAYASTHVDKDGVWRWNSDGSEVRIWGVNYYPPFAVDHHVIKSNGWDVRKIIDEDLEDMALLGINGIRLHAFDREISREDGSLIDNEHMEALDYLIAEAGKRGISIVLTPIAWWGDRIKDRERSFSDNYRMIDLTYKREEAWPILVRYLKEFCSHVNRYTGKRYADDPTIIAFESVNEPLYHRKTKPGGFDLPDATVLDFINTMSDAIRFTGTDKPVFYCAWHGKNAVCAKARIDGITGSAYPFAKITGGTSANSRTELKGEYLRFIKKSTLTETNEAANASVAAKAKMIYEFNPSSYANAAAYPVFAKMFRDEGAQAAFLFVYDFKSGADRNLSWPGQYFNAAYTPKEAVSFAIAGEVMKRWKSAPPFLPVENECSFNPFFVNEKKDLAKMDGFGVYAFAGSTIVPPKRPGEVRRVMGCGKSPFVSSSGSGAFFMDRLEEGMWKLTLLPDVERLANPYAAGKSVKRRLLGRLVTMSFSVPDIVNGFSVLDGNGKVVARSDAEGKVSIVPGTYRLRATGRDPGASAAETPRFRQLHRVFAVEQEKIDAARQKYPNSFRDGIIVATFVGLKIGKDEVREFANHRDFGDSFKAKGLDVHMCISSTIGHKDEWTFENGMPKMTGSDGTTAKNNACPRSPEFLAYIREVFGKYAALKPSVIWFDDDFRMPHHTPVDYACFCGPCIRRFSAETGLELSRKELVDAIRLDTETGGVRVRRAWRDYSSRALTDIAAAGAEAVHAVDDSIAIGYMVCNPGGHGYAPPNFKTWTELGRNKDGIVYYRHGSGVYNDFTPYSHDSILRKNISIGRLCAATEGPGVVNLTEEVTHPYTRRTKSMKITFLEAALNIALAGADGITYDAIKPNLDEQLRDNAVVAEMHRRDGELQRLYSLVRGKRQVGIYPFFSPDIWLENGPRRTLREVSMLAAEDWCPLMYLGIPFTFREQYASALLLSFKSVRGMPRERIEKWLERGIVADGSAAKELDAMLGRKVSDSKRVAVCCAAGDGRWNSAEVWGLDASIRIKNRIARLCGGRMPSRVDTAVRLAQSTWDSADGSERVVVLFNMDFDDAGDAVLSLDGKYRAEVVDLATGASIPLGEGDTFRLPPVPAWSPMAVRLGKIPSAGTRSAGVSQ